MGEEWAMTNPPATVRPGPTMGDIMREAWAWCISAVTVMGAWFGNVENWLAALGILVAVLTAVERYYAIQLRKRQIDSCRPAQQDLNGG